jgi:hypothetical protein
MCQIECVLSLTMAFQHEQRAKAPERAEQAALKIDLNEKLFTPAEAAARWSFHVESVRRKLRTREILSIVIGRRRLIPGSEILRVEAEGFINS